MSFTRRGFLSLVASGVGSAVAAKVLPTAPRPRLAPIELLDGPRMERFSMSFTPELGFQEVVSPGGVTSFITRSQILFRPDRLLFAACDLERFELLPFVAADGETDFSEPVPASLFGPTSYGQRLLLGPVYPGQEIVLSMRNVGPRDAEVRGVIMMGSRVR